MGENFVVLMKWYYFNLVFEYERVLSLVDGRVFRNVSINFNHPCIFGDESAFVIDGELD